MNEQNKKTFEQKQKEMMEIFTIFGYTDFEEVKTMNAEFHRWFLVEVGPLITDENSMVTVSKKLYAEGFQKGKREFIILFAANMVHDYIFKVLKSMSEDIFKGVVVCDLRVPEGPNAGM